MLYTTNYNFNGLILTVWGEYDSQLEEWDNIEVETPDGEEFYILDIYLKESIDKEYTRLYDVIVQKLNNEIGY